MKLSKSKINTFLDCRRRFKYIYIDELDGGTNQYAELGLAVHSYAENIGRELKEIENPTRQQIIDIATKFYPYEEKYIRSDKHAQGLMTFFIDVLVKSNYRIFEVEQYIYDEQHNISGIVDIILQDKDTNELIIFDYKTGKVGGISKFMLELCMYRILIESKYPSSKIVSAGIFFTADRKYRVFNFAEEQEKGSFVTEEEYQYVFELIKYVRQQIQAQNFEPKEKAFDYFCNNFCPFKERCNKDGGI